MKKLKCYVCNGIFDSDKLIYCKDPDELMCPLCHAREDGFSEVEFDLCPAKTCKNKADCKHCPVLEAYEIGVKYGVESSMKATQIVDFVGEWIPVSERLPEENGDYLTTTVNDEVYCDYWNGINFNRTEQIIAWCPLPEPYERGVEE